MTVTMNAEERRLYESRPYKAYDENGKASYFKHLVDKRQAMETFGLTEHPPGASEESTPDPFKDYESKSTEAIRELCIARNVVGYQLMNKTQQIDALRLLDKRDYAARRAERAGTTEPEASAVTNKLPKVEDSEPEPEDVVLEDDPEPAKQPTEITE